MKYYTDGYMIGGNPSSYGGGYTIVREDGQLIVRQEIQKNPFTNNEAEILGILNAIKYAKPKDQISTDSMCCLTWANQGKSKARPDLKELLQEVKRLKIEKNINLMWEGREFNLAGIHNENIGGKIKRRNYDDGYTDYKEQVQNLFKNI